MAAKPGQILHNDGIDSSRIHSRCELVQPTAAEFHAADVVVEGPPYNDVSVLFGKRLTELLLVQQRVHLPVVIV